MPTEVQLKELERRNAIRRSDAFTTAATVLRDTRERQGEYWEDIEEVVIPLLEAEARKAGEEAA